ncbi:MAG: DUF3710 domain-containing protein [Actinomycetes bacterium]
MFGRRKDQSSEDADIDRELDLGEVEEEIDEIDASDDSVSELTPRPDGPHDISEIDPSGEYLDLGSVWLTPTEEMEIRLDVDQTTGAVVGVTCVTEAGAVAVLVLAAPRTEGIWKDVRRELRASITAGGGLVDEVEGPWGTEIRTQVPAENPDGTQGSQPARFVGIDGPRWFLRLVFLGPAAVDPAAAESVERIARGIVVVRDNEARAPGDLLPMKLPEQAVPALQVDGDVAENAEGAEGDDDEDSAAWKREDLSPFERGPEITEIR